MARRNERLEHLLTPKQQARLRKLRGDFQKALDRESGEEDPVARRLAHARVETLRRQLPPGGLSWPWWEVVLRSSE